MSPNMFFDAEPLAPVARWKPDSTAAACARCDRNFVVLVVPKHHCRMCGEVVCGACSKQTLMIPGGRWFKPQRVCDQCFESKG